MKTHKLFRGTAARIVAGLALGAVLIGAVASAPVAFGATQTGMEVATGRPVEARGQVVTAQPLRTLSTKEDVAAELTAAEFDPTGARYGVDTYQLIYRTVDAAGRPTVASGLLAVPRGAGRELRTVSYAHGTELNRTDVPSLWRDGWSVAPALTYASAGFAAVAPDYLGLGLGPGRHPFLDLPSEVTASVDLLRAARSFAPRTGHVLGTEVFATGFSQGAGAAVALARALAAGADERFRLVALAPVAGAYDFAGVELPALLDGRVGPPWNVAYLSYLLVSWNRLHHLYQRPADVFAARYAGDVEQLFDGVHTGEELVGALPDDAEKLLTPRGLAMVGNPSGPFAAALRAHDSACTDWAPAVPVRLYRSSTDEQAVPANSAHCAAGLRARGADARVAELGMLSYHGSTHLGANVLGARAIADWFGRL